MIKINELLIANGQLVAETLRHLANNEIDSDYFAVTSECESYGTEVDCEFAITDYARQAAVTVDQLVAALEAAERERDEYAEAERSTAVKNVTLQDEIYGLKAELARRDAAAGEPAVLPELEQDVKNIIGLLSENEWAEHCTKSELGRKLEGEITRLHDLRAQQQKVVELHKRKSTEVISGQRYSYVLLEDLLPELDAANVKWEVKK